MVLTTSITLIHLVVSKVFFKGENLKMTLNHSAREILRSSQNTNHYFLLWITFLSDPCIRSIFFFSVTEKHAKMTNLGHGVQHPLKTSNVSISNDSIEALLRQIYCKMIFRWDFFCYHCRCWYWKSLHTTFVKHLKFEQNSFLTKMVNIFYKVLTPNVFLNDVPFRKTFLYSLERRFCD